MRTGDYAAGMITTTTQTDDYERVAEAIALIESSYPTKPDLGELADRMGLSKYHFQRLFTRWAGISPKQLQQFLTRNDAVRRLAKQSVQRVSDTLSLSSPARLHDLLVSIDAVTPGEMRQQGAGLTIAYGVHPSPFGPCLVGETTRGLCHLAFVDGPEQAAVQDLQQRWPKATLVHAPDRAARIAGDIFTPRTDTQPLTVLLKGTNFQLKVWEALLRIPPGQTTTYRDIATTVCSSNAARAVGRAAGANPIAYLVPCHRVLRTSGALGGYAWGLARKQAILMREAMQDTA